MVWGLRRDPTCCTLPIRSRTGSYQPLAISLGKGVIVTGTHKLSIAYFGDFADPTLLIWGDADGLSRLAELLEELAVTGVGRGLADLPWIRTPETFDLRIEIGLPETGLKRHAGQSGDRFEWRLSADTARLYGTVVRGVAANEKPCHNYLESDTLDDGIEIKVSKGEYDGSSVERIF